MDDSKIISLFFGRSENAIKETDKKYGRLCMNVARNILGSEEDAAECVNDAYLGVWNAIPPARPSDFTAFICKITRNLSMRRLTYLTADKRNARLEIPLSEIKDVSAPDGNIDVRELGERISEFLKMQKKSARSVFIRRYWFMDSIADIAKRYSFSESKVKSMLYHTRNKLYDYLKKEGYDI